jgi:hypothetical protein
MNDYTDWTFAGVARCFLVLGKISIRHRYVAARQDINNNKD